MRSYRIAAEAVDSIGPRNDVYPRRLSPAAQSVAGNGDRRQKRQCFVASSSGGLVVSGHLQTARMSGVDVLSSRILVRPADLGRSHRFYRDVLGLAIYREFGPPDNPGVVSFSARDC